MTAVTLRSWLWGVLMLGISIANAALDFEYGKRPLDGTFDPTGFLDLSTHREITRSISLTLADDNQELFVVVLDDLQGAPPEFVAKRFADAWKTEETGAVILHVPGRLSSPWIVPFGAAVDRLGSDEIIMPVRRLRDRLSAEEDEAKRLRMATPLVAEMLKTLIRKRAGSPSGPVATDDPHERMMRMIRIYAALGFTAILGVIGVVARILLRKPHGKVFPDFHPHKRLGAPFCGGNHVVVRIVPGKNPD